MNVILNLCLKIESTSRNCKHYQQLTLTTQFLKECLLNYKMIVYYLNQHLLFHLEFSQAVQNLGAQMSTSMKAFTLGNIVINVFL
jgi:hypothetical protein